MCIRLIVLFTLAVSALGGAACENENKRPAEKSPAAASRAQKQEKHAPADVKPGSYEDWCGEHHVPESQCTRCNPDLIAAFKATDDWCAEHGLPESQCLKCNPAVKIVRPPKSEAN